MGCECDMPNVGLVLSGGFAKGAYQVGVLNAIKETFKDEPIKCISASSVGALNSYAYAHDKMDIIENMWRGFEFSGFRSFYNVYVRSHKITDAISELVSAEDFPQPDFYLTCLNVTKLKLNYINLKNADPNHIKDYLLASVMMPVFTKAVEINGSKYIDGGMIDNIPVRPLMEHTIDYGIVVHFDNDNYLFENEYFDNRLLKINFMDEKVIKTSLAFDQNSILHMIKSGYERSMELFEIVFKNGIHDVEYIHQKIKLLNGLQGAQKSRLTGDVIMSGFNKAVKKVISYKI